MTSRFARCSLAAALVLGAASALPLPAPLGPAAAQADEPAPRPQQRQREIDYITFSIDHHAMGVLMAQIGIEKATDPRLIAVSHQIAQSQAAEIQELQGWLHDWYGQTHEPMMMPGDQEMLDYLDALPEGEAFDTAYSVLFIQHHATIIARSREDRPRFYHHELRQFASMVIQNQTREITHVFLPVLFDYWFRR